MSEQFNLDKFTEVWCVNRAKGILSHMAENDFKEFPKNGRSRRPDELTTNQVRKLLELSNPIYDSLQNERLDLAEHQLINFKIKSLYLSGRNAAVYKLVQNAELIAIIDAILSEDLDDIKREQYMFNFCRYIEAFTAYFKYFSVTGREQ